MSHKHCSPLKEEEEVVSQQILPGALVIFGKYYSNLTHNVYSLCNLC